MVGKPGQSKGCNTCRRRKKGCDLQRPKCGQCQKLNLECGGYTRDTVWVNMTHETGLSRRRKKPQERGTEIVLSEPFARSAYHEKYLGMFWGWYLPNGRAFPVESAHYTPGLWMNDLHQMAQLDDQFALKKILLALAVTSVGQQDGKSWMVEKGISLYGSSLATLASQIQNRDRAITENSYATSKLLSLYEILYGHSQQDRLNQVNKWNLHLKGELGYLSTQGPETFMHGFAHNLFADGRGTVIATALVARKATPLNTTEWKTTPWRYIPKTAKDILSDAFAEIPGLLEELDEMRAATDPNTKEALRQQLIKSCTRTEQAWFRWKQENGPRHSPVLPDTMQPMKIFDHFISAHIMCNYYAMGVFIYNIFHHTADASTPLDERGNTVYRMLCREMCKKILEIIPTFLNPFTGSYGVHGAMFPGITLISYLTEVDDGIPPVEIDRFYELVNNGGENGKTIKNFVDSFITKGKMIFK